MVATTLAIRCFDGDAGFFWSDPDFERAAEGYWGQIAISLWRVAAHPQGQPEAGRIWALTPITRAQRHLLRLPFLLDTLIWASKEKYLACRGETRLASRHSQKINSNATAKRFDQTPPNKTKT